MAKELTPANIVVAALRAMRWEDRTDFERVEYVEGGGLCRDVYAGERMAHALADAIEAGRAAVVLGEGVSIQVPRRA